MNTNENAVGAVFPNEAAADAAIESLHAWDVKVKDVELGAIGTVKLENGKAKVKVKKGGFFTRALKLDDDDMAVIVQHLDGEKVCVVVRSDDYEVSMVRTHLKNAGGQLAEFKDPYDAEERKDVHEAGVDAMNIRNFDKGMDQIVDVASVNKSGFN